jgi:S-adenosylmethionine:tRNA ribosyltransferase-isomerase
VPPRIEDFHYDLPDELIARYPLEERSASRMLVLDRATQTIHDDVFVNFPQYLKPDDCLVLNNTRVIPARLYGHRPGTTGKVELFLLRALNPEGSRWRALVRPGKKLLPGTEVVLSPTLRAIITAHLPQGERELEFRSTGSLAEELEAIGHVPLPPYLNRPDEAEDRERYQTVFARHAGAAAAPTAGLHFTPEILAQVPCPVAEVTLHVGLGTFQPLSEENLRTLTLHHEFYEVSPEASQALKQARRRVAIGTTSVRTIETTIEPGTGETNLFITPGYEFRATGAMLTNFHLPGSSLMMLVAAFAGYELTMSAYRHAVAERYRFFSYGDCMLIT